MKVVVGTLLKEYSGLAGFRGKRFCQSVLEDLGSQEKRQLNGSGAQRRWGSAQQEYEQKE
jgi:hypothetical protein